MLEVSEAGPWAKPPGSTGVVILVLGVWIVITGCPIVQGACWSVIWTGPGTVTVPPIPMPAPPVVGASGNGMLAYWQGAKNRQIFAVPERPMVPPPGGPPEIAGNEPVRFCIPVKIRLFVEMPPAVIGRLVVIGPMAPLGSARDARWLVAVMLTFATAAPSTSRVG